MTRHHQRQVKALNLQKVILICMTLTLVMCIYQPAILNWINLLSPMTIHVAHLITLITFITFLCPRAFAFSNGVVPFMSVLFGLAPHSSSMCTIAELSPFVSAARYSGVAPTSSSAFGSALALSSSSPTWSAESPLRAATCSGVFPRLLRAFGSASALSNNTEIGLWLSPFPVDMWRGVASFACQYLVNDNNNNNRQDTNSSINRESKYYTLYYILYTNSSINRAVYTIHYILHCSTIH